MSIRCVGVAILIILTLLCSGCYGSEETDAVAYVLVIGTDKGEGGKLKATYQIAIPRKISGGIDEKGNFPKSPWIINTITMPTPSEARMLLKSTMARTPKLNHIVAIIFSEELARKGIARNLDYNIRNRDYRESIYLIVVPGTTEEYMRRNIPTLETNISKFYEIFLSTASESGYYQSSTLHEFYTRFKNASASPYAIYSGINPMIGEGKPAGGKTPEQKGTPYLSGGAPRTGTENPAEFFGLAVFRGDKMVGVLNSDEARAVAILQGRLSSSYVGVVDPLQPKKDAVNINIHCGKPKITAELNDGMPVFDVQVNIEGEILGITSEVNYEASGYRELLETQVANLFKGQITAMIKHTQELGTDPAGFGLYLRPEFANTSEMEQADLTALYQAADIRVNVTAKIRRTGLKWRNSSPRD